MIENHPITPPPELVQRWTHNAYLSQPNMGGICHEVATQAARWGADQELEACCEWLQDPDLNVDTYKLRAARRSKPPSLAKRALIEFESHECFLDLNGADTDLLRAALERLKELEKGDE